MKLGLSHGGNKLYEDWTPEEVALKDEMKLIGHLPHQFRTESAADVLRFDAGASHTLVKAAMMLSFVNPSLEDQSLAVVSSVALTSTEEDEYNGFENSTATVPIRADDAVALCFLAAKTVQAFGVDAALLVLPALANFQEVLRPWQDGKIEKLIANGMTPEEIAERRAETAAYFAAEFTR